jgi:serine/threonine protein kinase
MSSSFWGSRFSDEGGQGCVSYRSRQDEGEIDVGDILAIARNGLPYIPPNRLIFDRLLGRGSSFQVNREVYTRPRRSPYYVAVKYLQTATDLNDERKRRFAAVFREIRVLTHPALRSNGCIMPALGYGWINDEREGARPYLVVDYSDHGSLPQYLNRCKVPLHERIELAIDIATALKSLHACGIVHGDVKPENVIVFDHGVDLSMRPQGAKLADFGCSLFEQDFGGSKDVFYLGTPKYNAPEIVGRKAEHVDQYEQSFNSFTLADCYSFGLLLWEILNNGGDFISASWLESDETGIGFLSRLSAAEEDGLLHLASAFCDESLGLSLNTSSVNALKQTFGLSLRDRRSCRGTMEEIARALTADSR